MIPSLARLWKHPAVTAINSVFDKRILETVSALYLAQFVNQILPMVMIPFLARVLGQEGWGTVVFVQAIGSYLLLTISYSFELSATREVARHQDDPESLKRIVSGVLGARLSLVLGCIALIAAGQLTISTLSDLGSILWWGAFWYIAMAIRPFWFFLGIERVRLVLMIEVSLKALAVASVFLFVHSPSEAWMVFALQGGASALATVMTMVLVYRKVAFQVPDVSSTITALRMGWHLFVFRASTSVYGMSNAIILGFVASPVSVAYYGAAQKLNGVLFTMLSPIVQAMFPRASVLIKEDRCAAARMARITTITSFSLTTFGAVILYITAPLVTRVALGPDYGEAASVLRILTLVLIINGISIPLGNHWMIPSGLDRLLTKVTIAGGVVHIPIAVLLGTYFAHTGIAWAFVITETFILVTLLTLLIARGLGPFRLRFQSESANSELT